MQSKEVHINLDVLQLIKGAVMNLEQHDGLSSDDHVWHLPSIRASTTKSTTNSYDFSFCKLSVAYLACVYIQTIKWNFIIVGGDYTVRIHTYHVRKQCTLRIGPFLRTQTLSIARGDLAFILSTRNPLNSE